MNERPGGGQANPPITAEDLTLHALALLPAEDNARMDALLRSSRQAREELALIRGDLAVFALATPQHTPPALTRQRLMKQVARERRTVPIPMSIPEDEPFTPDPPRYAIDEPLQRSSDRPAAAVRPSRMAASPEFPPSADDPFEAAALPAAPPSRTATMFEQYFSGEQTVGDPVPARGANRQPAAQPSNQIQSRPREVFPEDSPEDRYVPARAFTFTSFGEPESEAKGGRGVSLFTWSGWAAAVALGVVALVFVRQNYSLQQKAESQSAALAQSAGNAQRAEVVLQTLSSSAAQRFVLNGPDAAAAPGASVTYLPEHGSLVFQGSHLEALPPYKTYELWLIPVGQGRQPMPAGTFKPDAHGFAIIVLPSLPPGTIAGNFGVTIEETDGASAPTLPILLIGQQPQATAP